VADNIENFNLLPTKLNRPPIDSWWIVRPRLLSALDGALGKKLTLISAPAGYGKTTLAAQWLDRISHPSAWLSLDEHDSDPGRFLGYVIASIRRIFPQFGLRIEPLLSSPTLPPADYLADILISDLAALAETLVLVFDDFHTIESGLVQRVIDRLVKYLPDDLHLVIATRVDPPLPLAQWRVRNWLADFRVADLGFSRKETQAYFDSSSEVQVSDDVIERIFARSEGWVASLQLARLSLADAGSPDEFARRFSSSNQMIAEFLMDEVISMQPDEIKDFLSVTSLLERFCAPLCNHLLAGEGPARGSRRLIDLLRNKNLFLIPLDGDGTWYRYHHLFKTILSFRMKAALPQDRQARIHHRAGEWFAGRGHIEDALRHLIAAGDLDAAAERVEQNMHAVIDRDLSRRALKRWLDMFPHGAEKSRPALLVAHIFIKMFRWDFMSWDSLMDRAEALLKDPACEIPKTRRQNLLGDIAVQRATYLCWQGDAEGGLRHSRRGLQTVPKKHRYAHTLAIMYNAAANALCGRKDGSLRQLSEALTDDCSQGSPNAGQLLVTKIAILSYAADWDAVMENAQKILQTHETAPQADYWLGYAHYFLGSAAYERNLLDAAADHFGRVSQMRYRVTTRVYHDALIGLALVAWAKSDAEKAGKYIAQAYSFAIEVDDPFSIQISDSIELRQAILTGKVSTDPVPYTPTIESVLFWLVFPTLTHAEYLVNRRSRQDCSAGLELVEKGLKMARHHHNIRLEIQYQAVSALALKCAGRLNEALELLEKTLTLAEPRRLVRSFVDRGPLMAELLRDLSAKRPENRYAKSLLDACRDMVPLKEPDAGAAQDPAPDGRSLDAFFQSGLSNRELDVLLLLGERLTNKEIAERLCISPITVKTHTANIYRKLKVKSRRQAVARAVKLGLLPSHRT